MRTWFGVRGRGEGAEMAYTVRVRVGVRARCVSAFSVTDYY